MSLWHKVVIEQLGALGDRLWANLVATLVAFLDRLTLRRVVLFAGLVVFAMAFASVFTADVAIIFAGDMMLYFDIATAVMLIVARRHLQHALPVVADAIRKFLRNLSNVPRRHRSRQRRKAIATRHKGGTEGPKQPDDEPAAWDGFGYAFA